MEICYSKRALKFLGKQEEVDLRNFNNMPMKLPAGDVKKLIGEPYYRLRVGDFRVLFTRGGYIIEVAKVDSRGQIYK